MQRPSDQKKPRIPPAGDLLKIIQIFAYARALERLNPLRRNPKLITHRKSNAFFPDIQREHTSRKWRVQVLQVRII